MRICFKIPLRTLQYRIIISGAFAALDYLPHWDLHLSLIAIKKRRGEKTPPIVFVQIMTLLFLCQQFDWTFYSFPQMSI